MTNWRKIADFTVVDMEKGRNVLFYNKEWVDQDFCPDGIVEGYATVSENDEVEFVAAMLDGEGEFYHAIAVRPTHWMWHPAPPEEVIGD